MILLTSRLVVIYQGQKRLHDLLGLPLISFQQLHCATGMQQVGEEGGSEVEAEWMNARKALLHGTDCGEVWLLRPLQNLQAPLNHLLLYHELNNRLRHNFIELGAILGAHLLEHGNLESLRDGAILLFLENRDDLLQNLEIHLARLTVRNVLDTLSSAHDDGEERAQRMLQSVVVHVEHLHDEVHALELSDLENIDRDDLLDKVPSLVGRDLKGVDPQAEKHLREALLGLCFLFHCAQELVLMVSKDLLRHQQMRFILIILQLQE